MFVVCEGIDLSGKSTLTEQISREIVNLNPSASVELLHRGAPKESAYKEYAWDIEDYRPDGTRHIVADRWHWGELIYGPIYRGKSELGTAGFRWVELFLKARGAISVHVTQTLEELARRRGIRGEDYLKIEDVERVHTLYREIANIAPTLKGDVAPNGSTNAVAKLIIKYAEVEEAAAKTLVPFPQYIGSVRPDVLLVGEQRGGKGPWLTQAPFGTELPRSGRFLFDALPEGFWQSVGVVNVNEVNITDLLNVIQPRTVVALGRSASDGLLDADIEHAGVPHPAYVKRFATKRQAEYGALIKQVSETGEAKFSWPS